MLNFILCSQPQLNAHLLCSDVSCEVSQQFSEEPSAAPLPVSTSHSPGACISLCVCVCPDVHQDSDWRYEGTAH